MSAAPFKGKEPGAGPKSPDHPKHGAAEAVYTYRDEAGKPLFYVCRFATPEGKTFLQGHLRANGRGWAWNIRGVERVVYRLPELAAHLAAGSPAPVYICEGEKDVHALLDHLAEHELPGVATCNPMGAGKWRDSYTDTLTGARYVVVVADNDPEGFKAAHKIAGELRPHVDRLELVRGAVEEPKADLADHLAAGHSLEELAPLELEEEAGEPYRIQVYTARALCELPEPPQTDRLLGPIVVRGCRTIIGAGTGEGKTTAVVRALGAVVLRREFLGWRGAGGRALVLDLEQGLRTVRRRLREAELDKCEAVDYALIPEGLALDRNTQHVAEVERLLAGGGYDVVALDPHYKAHTGDANAEAETKALMLLLDRWRTSYGFALLLPAHTRKIPAEQGGKPRRLTIHDIFGSSALVRGAEIVLGLQLVRPGYSRLYFFKDRDGDDDLPVGGDPWGLLFDRERGFRRDPHETEPPRDLEAELRELCADGAWRTKTELRAPKESGGVGAGDAALEAALGALVEGGEFEYAAGPEGRSSQAKCWRLRTGPAQGSTSTLWDHVEPVGPGAGGEAHSHAPMGGRRPPGRSGGSEAAQLPPATRGSGGAEAGCEEEPQP